MFFARPGGIGVEVSAPVLLFLFLVVSRADAQALRRDRNGDER